ncbi:hypothetical protein LTS09_011400 [Friedmanniomyces endolithicus]|nr:hypothetical protein LTS09_011400 [Friedmanniomyces endolithicus]
MTWLLPFAAIVTPATLSVRPSPIIPTPSSMVYVPNLDFRSLSFSATIAGVGLSSGETLYTYNGPSSAVKSIAGAVAFQAAILPISAPLRSPNATWTVVFTGPSLRCGMVDADTKIAIEANIANHTFTDTTCYTPPAYLSWFGPDSSLPFPNELSVTSDAPVTYIALAPSLLRPSAEAPWNPAACAFVSQLTNGSDAVNWTSPLVPTGVDDTTILQCTLVEAQYVANLEYVNGAQSIAVQTTATEQPLKITRGFQSNNPIDNVYLQQLSYQSVLYAFNTWILGSIRSGLSQQTPLLVNSSIMSTVLRQAPEMAYLTSQQTDETMASVYHTNLQQVLGSTNDPAYQGLMPADPQTTDQSLAAMLEELFQNITVSLMSSVELQPNHQSVTAPPETNVTFVTFQNTYFYSPLKLWLAYGLAIAFAAVAVLVGLAYMYIDEASYSNSFSTIMRTSRGAELSIDIAHEDASGANPLPSEMAGATVRFQNGKAGGEGSSEQWRDDQSPVEEQMKSSAQDALLEGEGVDHGALHDDRNNMSRYPI